MDCNIQFRRKRRAAPQSRLSPAFYLKQRWLDEGHFEQRIFDLINDTLPDRYKVKLVDRSYHEGASREGRTLSEYLANRKRRGKRR